MSTRKPISERPISEWTQEEVDFEFARSMMIVSCLAQGVPVHADPVTLDRAAEAFRAAEPSAAESRTRSGRPPRARRRDTEST